MDGQMTYDDNERAEEAKMMAAAHIIAMKHHANEARKHRAQFESCVAAFVRASGTNVTMNQFGACLTAMEAVNSVYPAVLSGHYEAAQVLDNIEEGLPDTTDAYEYAVKELGVPKGSTELFR